MKNDSALYSEWSSDSAQIMAGNSLFITLSQNLMRYEQNSKLNSKKPKTYRISKTLGTTKNTINLNSYRHAVYQNKENNLQNEERPYLNQPIYCRKQEEYEKVLLVQQLSDNSNKKKMLNRKAKSSHQGGQQYVHALKTRQMKFQKRDKKKFKDRFVDIYSQLCGGKATKCKISLKQIDEINKQSKQQKIEMFMKLLKR